MDLALVTALEVWVVVVSRRSLLQMDPVLLVLVPRPLEHLVLLRLKTRKTRTVMRMVNTVEKRDMVSHRIMRINDSMSKTVSSLLSIDKCRQPRSNVI